MIVTPESCFCKSRQSLERLTQFVQKAAQQGMRADQVERELFKQLLGIGAELLKGYFRSAGDGDQGRSLTHQNKTLKRLPRKKSRVYRSIFGILQVDRCVYGTREGQKVLHVPLDARLGLPKGEQSYVLEDWMQRFCVQNAFSASVSSLNDLLGIRTGARTAERINRELSRFTEPFMMHHQNSDDPEQEILVITADAKSVPMGKTLEQQMGLEEPAWRLRHQKKQQAKADQRANKRLAKGQVKTRKHMAYVGAIYTIAPWTRTADDILDELLRKKHQPDRPRPANKRVWAEMTRYHRGDRWDGLPRLFVSLAQQASRRDPDRKLIRVCLMDGQRSLWKQKEEWLGNAVGILDLFHATEKLWKAAYCFYGQGSRSAEEFVTHYLTMLVQGRVSGALGSLSRKLAGLKGSKQRELKEVIRFFKNNRDHMKYDEYLAAGYPIGSGVVEGACRHLVGDRLVRTGMHWTVDGAQAMLSTRALYINDSWDEFIEYRIQTEQDHLYAQAA